MEINIKDFLTKEHKEQIQAKITEAINKVDVNKITKELQQNLNNEFAENLDMYYVLEEINVYKVIGEHMKNKIDKFLKNE